MFVYCYPDVAARSIVSKTTKTICQVLLQMANQSENESICPCLSTIAVATQSIVIVLILVFLSFSLLFALFSNSLCGCRRRTDGQFLSLVYGDISRQQPGFLFLTPTSPIQTSVLPLFSSVSWRATLHRLADLVPTLT